MTPRFPTLLAATFVLAAVAGCTATAATPPKQPAYRIVNGATYIPVPTAEGEYVKEAATLQLPPTHAWPQHPLLASESGTPEWYQIGYARQAADRFWFCSWAAVALQPGDAAGRRHAVEILQGMTKLYYYTVALDGPSKPLLVHELAAAKRGDLSVLRNDLQQNC